MSVCVSVCMCFCVCASVSLGIPVCEHVSVCVLEYVCVW